MRNHDTTRAEIARAAIRAFLRGGFENTTVDDIAAAAGISRRTYFRYFSSKDESLLSGMQEVGLSIADAFRRVPPSVPPLIALRDAYLEIEAALSEFPERQRALARMLRSNPRVHGALLLVQLEWIEEFADGLAARRPGGEEVPTDYLLAHAATDAWNLAVNRWLDDPGGPSLRERATDAFAVLMTLMPEQAGGGAYTPEHP
ncbi:MAG: TetR family transcriptional regulator [Dehalococcoidia bacterium]|nr:TetR family transcriptional regulator [Dehalococcoidia bacterium]